jgi:hypothetical protein
MRALVHINHIGEGSAGGYELSQRYPAPAHYSDWNLYAAASEKAVNPFIVDNELAEDFTLDQKVIYTAGRMLTGDKSIHIWINDSVAQSMYEHPAWQLYHWQYDEPNSDKLKADWAYMENLLGDNWPAYSPVRNKEETRNIIKSTLSLQGVDNG